MLTLRPHQTLGIDMLRQAIASGCHRPLLHLATGGGKTLIAAVMAKGVLAKGKRAVFVVPSVSLIAQTIERFFAEGIMDIGVLQADHPMTAPHKPIQIASAQTLARRGWPKDVDVVFVDEAHVAHRVIFEWMAAEPDLTFVGLSATPWTKGLGKHYDALCKPIEMQALIEQGFLSRYRVFVPSEKADLDGIKITGGDYHQGQLGEEMARPKLVADVVETWLGKGGNRSTLCFAVDRAHARMLAEQFDRAGVTVEYVDQHTSGAERKAIGERVNAGLTKVVVNIGCLTTGVDWDIRCIILARPTKSEMLHVQIVGRGLRTAEGKNDCVILDHAGNFLRLGMVEDIRHDRLDDGKMRRASAAERQAHEPKPKECRTCSFVVPPGKVVCPNCQTAIAWPRRAPETVEGELEEIGSRARTVGRAERQRWYSGLVYLARHRGKRPGWAAHRYRDKFGVWPRGLSDMAQAPAKDILNWDQSWRIRMAKRIEAERRRAA